MATDVLVDDHPGSSWDDESSDSETSDIIQTRSKSVFESNERGLSFDSKTDYSRKRVTL